MTPTRATAHTSSLSGIDAHAVPITAHVDPGLLPGVTIVGLPDVRMRESRVRLKSALDVHGFKWTQHIVVTVPEAHAKSSATYDLALAMAAQAANGAFDPAALDSTLLLGELSLGGNIRPVRGVVAHVRAAQARGLTRAVVPTANATEAAMAAQTGMVVYAADTLDAATAFMRDVDSLPLAKWLAPVSAPGPSCDMADVRSQSAARRAAEIAAAGCHPLLLTACPGSGKTMIARRLVTLLPEPTGDEALEIATIASAAGMLTGWTSPNVRRPFRAPHHTASAAAMLGGGDYCQPGEITLAHGGVLFLDELTEFRRDVLETLRHTIEKGSVTIARASARISMPAAPLLVAATNPCPCGFAGSERVVCRCTPDQIARYRARIETPLGACFHMRVTLSEITGSDLRQACAGESSASIRERVIAARANMPTAATREAWLQKPAATAVTREAWKPIDEMVEHQGLSARDVENTLGVAHTIARLDGRDIVSESDALEAIQLRGVS